MPPDDPTDLVEVDAGDTLWRFDAEFLRSNWTCIWGRGCHGIEEHKAAHLGLGCCSVGAELDGIDEAMTISALADTLAPELFQFHDVALRDGVFSDERRVNTRVVEGACIFLNRPGFEGGAGCALHLAANLYDEPPNEWKPSVCWQVPLRIDWVVREDDVEVATVRRWTRADWGEDGDTMAWCCTERDASGHGEAYVGDTRVVESLADELTEITGAAVYVQLRRALDPVD